MSRHRNIRNLTEEDYYDDYDDDYDDYEDEEEFDDSYFQPPPVPQPAELIMSPSQTHFHPKNKTHRASDEENLRLVEGMGFNKEQAKIALEATNGNVQEAVNRLLAESAMHAPKADVGDLGKPGISKPPAGFGGPPSSIASPSLSQTPTSKQTGISKPHVTFTDQSKGNHLTSRSDNILTPQMKKDYGPLPKLPENLKAELTSQKSRLSLVVLGHVDAGKSTLMGQVLFQLGHVAKRTVQKYQKQATEIGKASFALAWVMDEDDAERERGVTMDVATKSISTSNHDFVILDAPGHADFVPSMITGAAAADVGILVIAATTGEFEAGFDGGGQTREHIILARGLGVSQLIVAVNKLDSVQWSENRFLEIQSKIEPFLLKNGFVTKRIQFIPISGLNGINITSKKRADELYKWYRGKTLLEGMDGFQPAQRNVDKPLRVIVNDVFGEGSKGITMRCRVVQGVLQVGEKILVLPIGDDATVSKIEHGSAATENRHKYAMAGDTTDVVLLGIDIARVATGNIICHPHFELRPPMKRKVRAKVMVMDEISVPIIRGAQVLLHMHSIDVPTIISKLISSVDPRQKNSEKDRPRVLTSGVSATVEITFSEKITVETYNDCRALGRFVLRRSGDTVAIGIVESLL